MDTTSEIFSQIRGFAGLEAAVDRARNAAGDRLASAAVYRATGLDIDDVYCSMRLAQTPLERGDVEALVRRGVAVGSHRLDAYIAVDDYAEAAKSVRTAAMPNRRHGFISVEEIAGLHARVARRTAARPGSLREVSLRPFPSGMVAPPAWLIPQSLTAFVERFRAGPPQGASLLEWIADSHARFERIQPFESANGRTGRLLANLLLKRAGFLPFIVRPSDAGRYSAALRAAVSRQTRPLATLIARSLARSYALASTLGNETGVRPLSDFVAGPERAALYKAAQRGRLRAFRRDGRLYTSAEWIADYKALK